MTKEEKENNKAIFEAKFGKRKFVDGLSAQIVYKIYADRVVSNLEF